MSIRWARTVSRALMTSATGSKAEPGRRHGVSCRRKGPAQSGFTLIEVMLVLMILMFVTTMAAPAISRKIEEDQLFDAGRRLEAFLREARARAMLTGHPAVARLEKGGLVLVSAADSANAEERQDEVETSVLSLPGKAGLSAVPRRVAGAAAGAAEREPVIRFTPTGFCEIPPLRVSRGKAWIEKRFNPLTALVDEEAFNIP